MGAEPEPGAIRGEVTAAEIEAVARRREVFVHGQGWMSLGRLLNTERMTVVAQGGRWMGALIFDLGPTSGGTHG